MVLRNNHLTQHRQGIKSAVSKLGGDAPVKILALNWAFTLPTSTILRICGDRVYGRGERHQSLRGDDSKSHEDVIAKFIDGAQELSSEEYDEVIEMNVEETPEEAVTRVVDRIVPLFGLERPSVERIREACDEALRYAPSLRKEIKAPSVPDKARYFGLLAEIDVEEVVSGAIETAAEDDTEVPDTILDLWSVLLERKRVTRKPHITVVHQVSLPGQQPLWDRCTSLQRLASAPPFHFRLSHLVTDGKVMALTIEEMAALEEAGEGEAAGKKFLRELPDDVLGRLHITIGTRADGIAAKTAGEAVEKWKAGTSGDEVVATPLKALTGQGRIKPFFY